MSSNDHHEEVQSDPTKDDEEAGSMTPTLFPWDQLPPLPTPCYRTQRNESLSGIAMVTGIAGILVGLTHGIALGIGFDLETQPVAWWIIFSLIYGQAFLAILFLAAIHLVDPGVVPRSTDTCYPFPPLVAKWLAEGAPADDKPSELYFLSLKGNCKDTYCTRCLVWRKDNGVKNTKKPKNGTKTEIATAITTTETTTTTTIIETTTTETQIISAAQPSTTEEVDTQPNSQPMNKKATTTTTTSTTQLEIAAASGSIKFFHCNTCQRCVRHFDHHCNFFGRCIAGSVGVTKVQGNLLFFYGIIGVGVTAYITCLGSVLAGLLNAYEAKWVLPFFFLGLLVVHSCNPCLQAALFSIRRFVWVICTMEKSSSGTTE